MAKSTIRREKPQASSLGKVGGPEDLEWLHHDFIIPEWLLEPKTRLTRWNLGTTELKSKRSPLDLDFRIDFRQIYEADPLEQIYIVKRGVNACLVDVLALSMKMPKDKLIGTLGLGRATIQRKSNQQAALSSDESSRVMGVSKLIGQAQAMVEASGAMEAFDAAAWVAQWLDQPLPALNNRRPAELMDTAEGQAMVSQLLGRIQSGAYA